MKAKRYIKDKTGIKLERLECAKGSVGAQDAPKVDFAIDPPLFLGGEAGNTFEHRRSNFSTNFALLLRSDFFRVDPAVAERRREKSTRACAGGRGYIKCNPRQNPQAPSGPPDPPEVSIMKAQAIV